MAAGSMRRAATITARLATITVIAAAAQRRLRQPRREEHPPRSRDLHRREQCRKMQQPDRPATRVHGAGRTRSPPAGGRTTRGADADARRVAGLASKAADLFGIVVRCIKAVGGLDHAEGLRPPFALQRRPHPPPPPALRACAVAQRVCAALPILPGVAAPCRLAKLSSRTQQTACRPLE